MKHGGNLKLATEILAEGRALDESDRYITNKLSKYLLRGLEIDEGFRMFNYFAKQSTDEFNNAHSMQVIWFHINAGDAFLRKNNIQMALKMFNDCYTFFDDYLNDCYDFHSYCCRKFTMTKYIQMIEWSKELYNDPNFLIVALKLIEIYLKINDDAAKLPKADKEYFPPSKLQYEHNKEEKPSKNKKGKIDASDGDINGYKLYNLLLNDEKKNPLTEASKVLNKIAVKLPKKVEVWVASYDISQRSNDISKCSKSLMKSINVNGKDFMHPLIIKRVVDLLKNTEAADNEDFKKLKSKYLQDLTLDQIVEKVLATNDLVLINSLAKAKIEIAFHTEYINRPYELVKAFRESLKYSKNKNELLAKIQAKFPNFVE